MRPRNTDYVNEIVRRPTCLKLFQCHVQVTGLVYRRQNGFIETQFEMKRTLNF